MRWEPQSHAASHVCMCVCVCTCVRLTCTRMHMGVEVEDVLLRRLIDEMMGGGGGIQFNYVGGHGAAE